MKTDRIVFWGLCAIILLIPLPFGGNEPWAIFGFEAATVIVFGLHVVRIKPQPDLDEAGAAGRRAAGFPGFAKILLAVFFAVSLFQLVPWPPGFLRLVSPQTASIYENIHNLGLPGLGNSAWRPLSFAVPLSIYDLTRYLCYVLFADLAFLYISTRKRLEIVLWLMIGAAALQAGYGLAEYFSGSGRIFGWKNIYNPGSAFGTFINRNHFAGFLEMGLLVCLGFILARVGTLSRLRKRLPHVIFLGIFTALMGIGIVCSKSRGGLLCFALGLMFIMIFLLFGNLARREDISAPKTFVKLTALILLAIAIFVAVIGAKPLLERFSKKELVKTGRTDYVSNTLKLIRDYPIFGTGLGTYSYAYKMYEKDYGDGAVLNHAHNEYIEVIAESGIIGGGALIVLALAAFGTLVKRWGKQADPFLAGAGLGCLAGIFALLVHSLMDFNLRIPANIVYFLVLFALGWRAVSPSGDVQQSDDGEIPGC